MCSRGSLLWFATVSNVFVLLLPRMLCFQVHLSICLFVCDYSIVMNGPGQRKKKVKRFWKVLDHPKV